MSPTREELDQRHERLARALEVTTTKSGEEVLPADVLDSIDRLLALAEHERQRRTETNFESDHEEQGSAADR